MIFYQDGDIICSAVDAESGRFRTRVQVNGLKLMPPRVEPLIYLSDVSFSSVTEALRHGIKYIEERFPAGGPPFKTDAA